MQRNYKLNLFIIVFLAFGLCVFAQDEVKFKDVVLDNKPANLNIVTGEITFVNSTDKKRPKPIKKLADSTISFNTSSNVLDFHVVKAGETLLDIASKYNVSLTALKEVNNLETTVIDRGQKLRVTNFDAVRSTNTQAKTDTNNKTNTSNVHIVKSGEALFSLARRYNLSLSELKRKNNLNSNVITVGQKLRVNDFKTTNVDDDVSVWTVLKGDTLYHIARKMGINIDALKRLNGLTDNLILVGQKLLLK